ncbi:MAG: hypothetical protein EOO73_30695 [Myxococcales bacterium]|nr:MAG: hypothetical protein EOO73_30695 [Myxococcales bacterium]
MSGKRDSSLSDRARQLLAAERDCVEPAPLKARALARAQESLLAQRLSEVALRSAPWWTFQRRATRVRVGVTAAALGLAGLAAAGSRLMADPPPLAYGSHLALAAVSVAPPVAPALPARTSLLVEPPPASSPSASASASASARSEAPLRRVLPPARPSSARQYALELELLEPARRAIATGSYGAALEAVGRHEQAFPNGQLAEERSALRVRALWASGRRTEARAAAARFNLRYPRSGLLTWLREPGPSAP